MPPLAHTIARLREIASLAAEGNTCRRDALEAQHKVLVAQTRERRQRVEAVARDLLRSLPGFLVSVEPLADDRRLLMALFSEADLQTRAVEAAWVFVRVEAIITHRFSQDHMNVLQAAAAARAVDDVFVYVEGTPSTP